MIGLPEESPEDIAAIADLSREAARILPVKVNLSIFVPKPGTVFASCLMTERQEILKKYKLIKKRLTGSSKISVNPLAVKEAYLEADLCRAKSAFFSTRKFF